MYTLLSQMDCKPRAEFSLAIPPFNSRHAVKVCELTWIRGEVEAHAFLSVDLRGKKIPIPVEINN